MDHLEVYAPDGRALVVLDKDRVVVGAAEGNDVLVVGDATVSRIHAIFERYPTGWTVRDVGSRNGTTVNGERIWSERHLRTNDEVHVGSTRLVLRLSDTAPSSMTEVAQPAPALTRRETDVLFALCRPLATGDVFTEPASIKAMAKELVVTEAAIKQHLTNLYEKFEIYDNEDRRRVLLANQAIRRGVVNVAALRTGRV